MQATVYISQFLKDQLTARYGDNFSAVAYDLAFVYPSKRDVLLAKTIAVPFKTSIPFPGVLIKNKPVTINAGVWIRAAMYALFGYTETKVLSDPEPAGCESILSWERPQLKIYVPSAWGVSRLTVAEALNSVRPSRTALLKAREILKNRRAKGADTSTFTYYNMTVSPGLFEFVASSSDAVHVSRSVFCLACIMTYLKQQKKG